MAEGTIELGALQEALKGTFLTAIREYQASLKPEPQPVSEEKALVSDPKITTLGQGGLLATIDDFRIPVLNISLPWASATLGISAGTIVGNVIDVATPPKNADGSNNLINPVLQLVAAGAEAKFLPGKLGQFSAAAHIVKLALRYTPLGEWLMQIEAQLSRTVQSKAPSAKATQEAYQAMGNHHWEPAPGFASPAWN